MAAGAHLAAAASTTRRLPLRAQVFDSVIPLAVCPVIVLGLVLGRVVASGEEQDTRRELVERAAIIGSRIDEYLRAHDLAAASLALRVGAAPVSDAEAERMLVSAQRVYGDFDKIVLLDRAGERARRRERPARRRRQAVRGPRLVGDQGILHRADADRAELSLGRLPRQRLRSHRARSGASARPS